MPSTKMLIGSVANPGSGASIEPTMPAVATSTVLLPPASACVTASTSALRRARRSPESASKAACTTGSATADMLVLPAESKGEDYSPINEGSPEMEAAEGHSPPGFSQGGGAFLRGREARQPALRRHLTVVLATHAHIILRCSRSEPRRMAASHCRASILRG